MYVYPYIHLLKLDFASFGGHPRNILPPLSHAQRVVPDENIFFWGVFLNFLIPLCFLYALFFFFSLFPLLWSTTVTQAAHSPTQRST